MNLDGILALAADHSLSQLERARARRATRRIQQEYKRAVTEGRDLVGDVDLHDPLADEAPEAARIARAAQLAKLGTVVWAHPGGEPTWSDEMSLIFGYPPGIVRPSMELLFRLIHPEDVDDVRRVVQSAWREQTVKETTYRVVRPDRITRYVHWRVEVLVDQDNRPHGLVATGQDITEQELARQERDRLARRSETVRAELPGRDPVTGLLTRRRFADEIDRARRSGSGALLVVAVELVGPAVAGTDSTDRDRLAAAVAAVAKRTARRTDVCGLVGPSEFGVLMPDTTLKPAGALAGKIIDGLRAQSFVVGQNALRLDARGGLVRYQAGDECRGLDLLLDGETAWRRARQDNIPLVTLHRPVPAGERRADCRSRVRAAVADDSLTLYAQPILDLRLNQITRQEILLRLTDGAGRAFSPSAFLEMAERVDEMLPVDRWVTEHTMDLIAQGPQTSHYQVNISGRSLNDPDLLAHVHHLIDRYDIDPSRITFEITETTVIGNLTEALNFAHGVRQIGCQLALDDFGSGYSSFTYLKYLPVDLVKIDGDFISGICASRSDQVVVRSFVEICRDLGIRTAAEYVGDMATLELLRDYGVDFAQGYLIGEPRPVASHPQPLVPADLATPSDVEPPLRTALG